MKKIGWMVIVLMALAAAVFLFLHIRAQKPLLGPVQGARLTQEALTALMTNQLPVTKTAQASAPRFTVQANTNCVSDNLTGLIWARNANIASILIYGDTTGKVTWAEAANVITNARGINGSAYGGYTDWRLPNVKELHTLVEGKASNTAMNDTPFTNIQPDYYWSSTFYADTTDGAWGVNLVDGTIGSVNMASTYYLWPVRGGP